jgi:hypothetical protein
MPLVRMAQQRWPWLPAVFVDIQASKNRTGLRIERDITLQNDRARQINARTQVDNTSAGFRTSINRSIDCRRIQLFSVAHGAELPRSKNTEAFRLPYVIGRDRSQSLPAPPRSHRCKCRSTIHSFSCSHQNISLSKLRYGTASS